MKIFHCHHCRNLVFFESFRCVACGHALGFLPNLLDMGSLEPAPDGLWTSPHPGARGRVYRQCANYAGENICNWCVPADEPSLKAAAAHGQAGSFDALAEAWFPLTYVLNNLNRGLGLPDGYPFVLSPAALGKLRFVHGVIGRARTRPPDFVTGDGNGDSYLYSHGDIALAAQAGSGAPGPAGPGGQARARPG